MTQLLVLGTVILAVGPVNDSGDNVVTPYIIYSKSMIPGYEIVGTELPPNFIPQDYEWIDDELFLKSPPYQPGPDSSGIVSDSYNASLRRKAVKMQEQGQTFEAVQLLLQAQGVQS